MEVLAAGELEVAAVELSTSAVPAESLPAETAVYLDAEGVVHVDPASPETDIVVREFLNYELQHVVEVEADGQWTAFPVEQVQQVQVHQLSDSQTVDVSDGVAVPIELAPLSVDAALSDSEAALLSPLPQDPAPSLLSNSPAEGEESYAGPTNDRPEITDFTAYETQNGEWIITGRVVDDKSVAGLDVELDGLVQAVVQTNSNGDFTYITTFPAGTIGAVTALVTDIDDAESDLAYTWIST
jgi:hypothetical protein